MPDLKLIVEEILSDNINNKQRIKEDKDRFTVYSGRLKDVIKDAIEREFSKPKTVHELINRIVPINITGKFVDKLAALYRKPPIREPQDGNEADQDLIDLYTEVMRLDTGMKFANRLFKLHKHVLLEPYLSMSGKPSMRALPSHTFSLFSTDRINPEKPTAVVKHMITETENKQDMRFVYWDKDQHLIFDGEGHVVLNEMVAIGNEDGINPFGTLPFVHINESAYELYPIRNDDLIKTQVIINLLLTDLTFAQKYMAFSTLVIRGVEKEDVDVGPNSIIFIPPDPDGKTTGGAEHIKPSLETDALLKTVEELIGYLATTNNLAVGDISGKLNPSNAMSGISKIIDQAVPIDDRNDQIAFFRDAEIELWDKFSHYMLPYWVEKGAIDAEYVGRFSDQFALAIAYPELKPVISDKEKIELIALKLEKGFISKFMALKELNPEKSDDEIELMIQDMDKEKTDSINFFQRNMSGTSEPQGGSGDDTETR